MRKTFRVLAAGSLIAVAAFLLATFGGSVLANTSISPTDNLLVSTASYLGGSGDDSIQAVDIAPDGTVLVAGVLGGDYSPAGVTPTDLLGGGDGGILRIEGDGTDILSMARVPGSVQDLEINDSGAIVACSGFGVAVFNSDVTAVTWEQGGSTVTRCGITSDGSVAALSDKTISVYDNAGAALGEFTLTDDVISDVAIDSTNQLVYAVGYNNASTGGTPVQIPFLRAYDFTGTEQWKAYDWTADQLANDLDSSLADSRGVRITIGRDGELYYAGRTDGGNNLYRFDPQTLGQQLNDTELIGFDDYNQTFNISGARTLTFYARFNPATGAIDRGQLMLTRLSDGGGNSISPEGIAADSDGTIYLTGQAFASIDDRDQQQINGQAVGTYPGGEAYIAIISPDMTERIVWTVFTGNNSNSGGVGRAIAVRDGVAAFGAALPTDVRQLTSNPLQAGRGAAADGYVAIWPSREEPSVNLSTDTVNVQEGVLNDRFTVSLGSQPTADVTINLAFATGEPSGAGVIGESFVIAPDAWNTPLSIPVLAVDDTDEEGNHSDTITVTVTSDDPNYGASVTFNGGSGTTNNEITVNITDDDPTLLVNGGFEVPLADGLSWEFISSGDNQGVIQHPAVLGGSGGLLVRADDAIEYVRQDVAVEGQAGDSYTASFYFAGRGVSDEGILGIRLRLFSGEEAVQVAACVYDGPRGDFEWQLVTCTITADVAFDTIEVAIGWRGVGEGLAGIDSATLVQD
ncbi:MAG: hypothetical protein GYB68_02995 [Chloroflexi bacterium]|nr:hypothetical protein [Chloroflexota bacterium]